MTVQNDLGERLLKIREHKQAVVNASENAKILAAYAKSEQERAAITQFWYSYVSYVSTQINKHKEPKPRKVPAVFVQQARTLDCPLHSHHDVWQVMQQGAHNLGLQVCLKYAHDGKGIKSWYELSVEPA